MNNPCIDQILKQLEDRGLDDLSAEAYRQLSFDDERSNFIKLAVDELDSRINENEAEISDLEADNLELSAFAAALRAEDRRLEIKLGIMPVPGQLSLRLSVSPG